MLTHEFNDHRMKNYDKFVALYNIKATTKMFPSINAQYCIALNLYSGLCARTDMQSLIKVHQKSLHAQKCLSLFAFVVCHFFFIHSNFLFCRGIFLSRKFAAAVPDLP